MAPDQISFTICNGCWVLFTYYAGELFLFKYCLFILQKKKVSTVVKLVRDWRKSRRGRLSRRKLNQLPVIKFNREQHAQVFECCAICLEDFKNGDKIRELPCKHGYHKSCIDPWLTSNR